MRAKTADPGGATFGRVAPITFQVTNNGLSFPGFLWKIDHFVSLTSIKDKYAESWLRLWRSKTKLEQQSLQAREKLHTFHKRSKVHWLAITQILFEVIGLLREENQIDVADAIWHSVTNTNWRNGSCLESVTKFPEQLTVEKRRGMFWLEERSDGCFEHKWLVDRIMLQGGFWAGRLVRHSSNLNHSDGVRIGLSGNDQIGRVPQDQWLEETFRSSAQDNAKLNKAMPRVALISQADEITRMSAQQSPLVGQTYSQYQTAISMLTTLIDRHLMETDSQEGIDDLTSTLPTENMVGFATDLYNLNGRNSPSSLQQQRAVFDIKGDTSGQVLILTPFQKRLETLPRPETRSMSVSWVVHPLSGCNISQNERDMETLGSSAMVRGMWKYMVQPENWYNLV